MKIAILCHPYFPIKEPYAGGLEMIVHLIIKGLTHLNHEVIVYAHPESELDVMLIPVDVKDHVISEKYDLDPDLDDLALADYAFAKAVQHISQGYYDIVHNHTMDSTAFIALSGLQIPVLNTFHTPMWKRLTVAIEMMDHWRNMYVSAVSKSLASVYASKICHVDVVYNGIEVGNWNFNNHVSTDYLFWCGRICKEKGPEHAIQLALRTGKKLIIAGPKFVNDFFEKEVEPYLGNELIEYVGHLNHKELNRYMSNASVLIFTSLWEEPYGLVLAEALSCGTPVLGYNVGAASEIIDDTTGILVPVGDIDALEKKIEDVYLINRITCRNRAEKFCDYRHMISQYINLYDSIIKNYNA